MLKVNLKDLPESPGVYLYWAKNQQIYIGKAVNLKKRVESYFRLNLLRKTAQMVTQSERFSFIKVSSELEALLLEAKLIRRYRPKYNIIAKDDKSPLYVAITQDKLPRVLICRKTLASGYQIFYGPFPSANKVRLVMKNLRKIFPYADHKLGKRPCLYTQIGLCSPCPNTIVSLQEIRTYLRNINNLKKVLDGDIEKVTKNLTKLMNLLALNQKYEKALIIKKQIDALRYISQKPLPQEIFLKNPNVVSDLRAAESESLKSFIIKYCYLNIKNLIRLECFDVSHLSGTCPTASMVTFINGEPDKNLYRRFRLKKIRFQSDLAYLEEVARRRAKHFSDWGSPDLIIVDGGEAQRQVVVKSIAKKEIPVLGIEKQFETLIYLGQRLRLPNIPAKNLIVRIRDESHRFAKIYHNLLVKKDLFKL